VRRTLYLLAEDGIAFQTAANAIDVVESATGPGTGSPKLNIKVQLVMPKGIIERCLE